MDNSRMGGLARARSLSPNERSRIARRAAKARWADRDRGILPISFIRNVVRKALGDSGAKAYLFGSYARGEATPRSDIDILVVERRMPENWLEEVESLREGMGFRKNVDLIVLDEASFREWKDAYGTVQHEVAMEGVRLA